ncbi:hypothetical protein BKK49_04980 [Rodentibacter rarus]|uniref:Uncharacterized protein n=1 Tax=Rodentibacter rarus TaxID=1908260 RepID=A0A1V3IJR2_9PAST|nr:hypothetical protein [Rodentibacter rarus]OOF41370.1 hypothetical protein BKK50_08590 [Rodentibacter rarus]OOF41397.1 hypothetical protein BKK49_04980 [Rodentibacter rarus]
MKKLVIYALIPMLFACATERKSIAQINAERNSSQALVTTASLDQQRKQRQNELEEAILRRQQDRMETQTTREKTSVVTDVLNVIFR